MQEVTQKRQLAAIMFTDIVGYTALMRKSEEKALHTRRINREIHQQKIEAVGGTWLKEMGDGTLASFTTITEAVQAAIEIRKICKQELDIELKVGIHLGEIVHEDNDVFGDGVNIASCIQELAQGGGILISEPVYNEITNKENIDAAFIGQATLKNVDKPLNIYQILDGALAKPTIKIQRKGRSKLLGIAAAIILALIAVSYFVIWPKVFNQPVIAKSIAVLPFHNPTDDESQKHYGVGLATEIRSKLSQSKHFEFISSMRATMGYGDTDSPVKIGTELEVKYLLSGIYQISGDHIKVDVELIDTQSGRGVWNLSFNELFTDIFEIQAKIASQVFNEFAMADNQDQGLPTQNIEAYGHYLKGLELLSIHQTNDPNMRKRTLEAEEQLNFAIQKDSSFINPYVSLVYTKTNWLFAERWLKTKVESDEFAMVKEEVMNLKDYTERHFSDSWKNILINAMVAYHANFDYEEGLKLFEEVLYHDPDNFEAHMGLAAIYKRKLMQREAINHLSRARQLNPGSASVWGEMSVIFESMGDYSSAEKAAQNAIDLGEPLSDIHSSLLSKAK